jgi:hypothetical protein
MDAFLKMFGIKTLPKKISIEVKEINESGQRYYIAYLNNNIDNYIENIGILVACTKKDLRRDLKNIYGLNIFDYKLN